MYIELEAIGSHDREDITTVFVGPFSSAAAALETIAAAPRVDWEPNRRITGNGVQLQARAIVAKPGRGAPIFPVLPFDRDDFAALAFQYAKY